MILSLMYVVILGILFHLASLCHPTSLNLLQDQSSPGCGALISVSCQSFFHCWANVSSINRINPTEMYTCSIKACHSCSKGGLRPRGSLLWAYSDWCAETRFSPSLNLPSLREQLSRLDNTCNQQIRPYTALEMYFLRFQNKNNLL